jgi:hypothetical protein
MTTTCSSVAVVENEFRFFMNEAPTKDAIYTSTIQSVIEYEIVSCLMAYTSTLIARSRGGALQSPEIDYYISILGV